MPSSGSAAADLWGACARELRARLPESTWRAWLEPVHPLALDDERLVLVVPSSVSRERIEQRHLGLIEEVVASLGLSPRKVVIQVAQPLEFPVPAEPPDVVPAGASPRPSARVSRDGAGAVGAVGATSTTGGSVDDASLLDELPLNADYTFEAFVVGSSNHFAHAAALSVAETPAKSYNPLFIYGPPGLGKTHLLHAIADYARRHYPNLSVRYVTTETFLNHFVDSIRYNTTTAFKRHYRQCHILLIDDIQFIEKKERVQEELFHTFNYLHGAGRQVVLSADRAPNLITTIDERLLSRLEWGLITDVFPPDLETRLAILRKKAERMGAAIPDDVLSYIATEITDNIRKLEGALNRIWAFSNLNRQPLTLALARDVLVDMVGHRPRPITPKAIIEATAEMFGLSVDQLCGKSRSRPLVTARQISMYLFRELTDFSYPAIGREFGDRDHTTVMHAVEKINGMMAEKRTIYDQVKALRARIENGG